MIKFNELIEQEKGNPEHCVFLLIDAAQQRDAIEQWLADEKPQVRSLFENMPERSLPISVAPVLYAVNNEPSNIVHWVETWLEQAACVNVLSTGLKVDDLVAHLQPFLNGKLPSGEEVLFRFYDPTVACLLPNMLEQESYQLLMSPLHGWWVANDDSLFEKLPDEGER